MQRSFKPIVVKRATDRESFGTGQRELRLRYEIHGFRGF